MQSGERVERVGPGVYLTLVPTKNGHNELHRVRFSRHRFKHNEAEQWWHQNRWMVAEKYLITTQPGGFDSGKELEFSP
jgi:hypothetical protein